MSYIENRIFDEIAIGDTASLKRTLTQKDIELFAIVSGDVNPAHVDAQFAKDDMFHRIIAHGMWGGSLLSTVLGTELPGPGTIYLNQTLKFLYPVSLGDVIDVSLVVTKKIPEKHIVELDCKCVNQQGKEVITGIATVIAPTVKVKRKRFELPTVSLQTPGDAWYQKLVALKENLAPITTAVVNPIDTYCLLNAISAAEEGLISPIFIGPEPAILAAAKQAKIDISAYPIITASNSKHAAEKAVALARDNVVEALMNGMIDPEEFLGVILAKNTGLRTERRMSHVFSMNAPNYFKPLFLTDAVLNIRPGLPAKRDITQNAIDLFQLLGLGTPKVALVSAFDRISENIPSTLDAAALCKMAEQNEIAGGTLFGPLTFDQAISVESAQASGIYSSIAGDADIIVFPDIESANILYKEMVYLHNTEAAGIVIGAKVPIIFSSITGSELSRKASCAMALVYARKSKQS